ncbi:hypothetical protein Hdeb2414_s0010g00355131 [Helianthus debilis subsp. tardiflorus]
MAALNQGFMKLGQGHNKWITGISWEPVRLSLPCRHLLTPSRDGDARIRGDYLQYEDMTQLLKVGV